MAIWTVFRNGSADILSIAKSFGHPIPSRPNRGQIDVLAPRSRERSQRTTLSGIYGLSALPFHMDTAHWFYPCRYVVLSCETPVPGIEPTVLLEWRQLFSKEERRLLAAAIVVVRNGRNSFYAPALESEERFLRYDPGCVTFVGLRAQETESLVAERLRTSKGAAHVWSQGDVLVIDNWQALHSRPAVPAGSERRLSRILVMP
jgi:hypothetical protein